MNSAKFLAGLDMLKSGEELISVENNLRLDREQLLDLCRSLLDTGVSDGAFLRLVRTSPNCADVVIAAVFLRGKPMMQALAESVYNGDRWESSCLDDIARIYWSNIISKFIHRRDFRRAWDEIRNAYRGFRINAVAPSLGSVLSGYVDQSEELSISWTLASLYVNLLYSKMRDAEVIPDIDAPAVEDWMIDRLQGKVTRSAWFGRSSPCICFLRVFHMSRDEMALRNAVVLARHFGGWKNSRGSKRRRHS